MGSQEVVLAETLRHDYRDNRLLAALSSETLASLDRDLKHVSIAQGAFPQTGLISLLVVTLSGDSIETATVGREGAVGLHGSFGERFSFTRAVTHIGGRFSIIGASRFAELANGNTVVRNLISRYTEVL
jgi:hypothetical protein